ncbi:T9SS type A sorting domain-containing protein [Melioribacter sp. OK-1-Me]|uniref:T9SS type A sorting domain-containing protein n=1 Tax=Melioribacter sp. OK-1-Me TaxID=3461410 RepID=UPI0040451802
MITQAADAFKMIEDPGLKNKPNLMLGMMEYYVTVANKTKDTPNDYWDPATQDMDRRPIGYYVNEFDASYSTSSPAYTGAAKGFPAGDLNWFPELKVKWLAGENLAENVLRLRPFDGTPESYLMAQIRADTTANGGIPEGRVYELEGGKIYLNTESFYVEKEYTFRMRSSNNQKAIIYQYPTGTGDNPQDPPGYLLRTRGGDIILEGIAITGYYEPGDDPANGVFDQLYTVGGTFLRTDGEGASIILKDCIFSNVSGQVIRTEASTKKIEVEDCIFANLGALSTSNFGAGKGIDLRASTCDSLILINNTFVNYIDRPIRHYNFSNPLAGTGNIGYGLFDHNTFVNGMGFHGLLSLGNVGEEIVITNNLFVDAFAAGEDSTDQTRTAEWANTGEQYANGNNRMAWIFAAPNDTTRWVVDHNYYAVSAAGQSFFDKYPEIGVGEPLSNYIKSALGAQAADAFKMIEDPGLKNKPNLMLGMMEYYVTVANKTKDTPNDYWDPATQDMDRRPIGYYVNEFDASYSTSSPAYTGAAKGFPAGDLNWFPELKKLWLEGGTVGVDDEPVIKNEFVLEQNYPNPFNPTTSIRYQLPKASNVTITVYNSLGQEVAKLVNNELQSAGVHTITWNAKDNYGKSVASGIYFYQLKSSDLVLTKKMILLK